jgi:short-subunit dehydrogenase involved in D-alanine esterification of teichoic acids
VNSRGNYRAGLGPYPFVAGVMKSLEQDLAEIGYGTSAGFLNASRAELDRRFDEMNRHL